ncbi:UNVERIFIED_CONTAM: hypothetical protein FKN15_015821 [Acipenser sinensis]
MLRAVVSSPPPSTGASPTTTVVQSFPAAKMLVMATLLAMQGTPAGPALAVGNADSCAAHSGSGNAGSSGRVAGRGTAGSSTGNASCGHVGNGAGHSSSDHAPLVAMTAAMLTSAQSTRPMDRQLLSFSRCQAGTGTAFRSSHSSTDFTSSR